MAEFPEAFWAAATWPMSDEVKDIDGVVERLQAALAAIHPNLTRQGVFAEKVWKILRKEIPLEGFQFWQPNAGALYPAVYELAERSLAAAKALRPFDQLGQEGYRCTQCGEREWLTDDKTKLQAPRGKRKPKSKAIGEHEVETIWAELAANPKRRAWAKEGEHLCAVCTAKRLWPNLFAAEVGEVVGAKIDRFVVSTHALAVSTSVEINLDAAAQRMEAATALGTLKSTLDALDLESATLPKRLMRPLHLRPELLTVAKKLPALLERVRDEDNGDERIEGTDIRLGEINRLVKGLFGERLETYYAVIQMDGDRMGAWLAGNEEQYQLRYRDTWHSQVKTEVERFGRHDPNLDVYTRTFRPPSPARHAAISRALNDFSIHLVRHIVEDCVKGKLLYAGGDDVLALVAVDDLFEAMQLLRLAYSGLAVPESLGLSDHVAWLDDQGRRQGKGKLWLSKGYGFYRGHLMTLMGHKATASMGAVVAHHTAPLAMVLRQLREAESRAKSAGRDRFCVRVLKRGGGEVSVVSPWWKVTDGRPDVETSALRLMKRLRDELALTDFSRGAIYKAQQWFEGLTDEERDARDPRWRSQVAGSLAYQFHRQKGTPQVARDIVDFVCDVVRPKLPRTMLDDFLVAAEFFARESRVRSALQQGAAP
jgi:CRISPR-associated protein Cmr2